MSADPQTLARSALLAGLAESDLREIATLMHPRVFEAGEELCRAGEPSDSAWLITGGLVHLLVPSGGREAGGLVERLRKGDVVGDASVIAREPYGATALARISTSTLELSAADLLGLADRYPQITVNMIRRLQGRLARERLRTATPARGETVALAIGPSLAQVRSRLIAAAKSASPKPVTALDREFSFAGAVTAADELVSGHATVLLDAQPEPEPIAALLAEVDRVVALAGTGSEAARLGELRRPPGARGDSVEVVLVGDDAARAARSWPDGSLLRVVRHCAREADFPLASGDLAWLARHLTHTKLGLALGAGGAKGYAHIGVLEVLQEGGYVVDYVAGSSIGAIVAAYLALGMDAREIDATLRRAFDADAVAEIFKTSLGGATGIDVMTRLMRETTGGRGFQDTSIPLTIMAVDLSERAPAPLREGPLWQALLAATALAGVFRPYERDGHRLVDGLALVPVPTGSVLEDGADVTIAVNLIGPRTLERWPGGPPPEPPAASRRRPGMLDTLLEVMDLSQLDVSVRHSALADVVITPRFGPCDWRDFHLADLFRDAGRAAAQEQIATLQALALPVTTDHQGGLFDRPDAVRI